MGENPQGQGSGHSLKKGKHGSQGDCENGGTWAGHVVHWMPCASIFLSVSWSPFLIQSWPRAAFFIFPFRGLSPSCGGVPLRSGVRAWDADWAAPGGGGGRPDQARVLASHQVILAPGWSFSWENRPSFLDPSAPGDRKLRPENAASCYLRAVAAPVCPDPLSRPFRSALRPLAPLLPSSCLPTPPRTPSRPSHRPAHLSPGLFSYLRPSHVSSCPRHLCSGLSPALLHI